MTVIVAVQVAGAGADMLAYIRQIQLQLISEYGFAEKPGSPGLPLNVPDGDYPMTIDGKLDHVRIENGFISCCNFDKAA